MQLQKITNFLGVSGLFKGPQQNVAPVEEFNPEKLGPKEVYISWETSLSRERTGISKKFTRTFIVIAIVMGLLLAIMQDFILILVIGSVIFVSYVFSKYQLGEVRYEISNHGIMMDNHMYYWHQLSNFFFSARIGGEILVVDTKLGLPGRLFISFSPENKERIQEAVGKHLTFLKVEPKTSFDRAYDSVLSKFNFEDK